MACFCVAKKWLNLASIVCGSIALLCTVLSIISYVSYPKYQNLQFLSHTILGVDLAFMGFLNLLYYKR